MLTREEADRLKDILFLLKCSKDFENDGVYGTLLRHIDKLIEKPKLEAKVGYYYKDGHGNIEKVTEITAIRIITNFNNHYLLDGTKLNTTDARDSLDLSTAYQLVEVKDD